MLIDVADCMRLANLFPTPGPLSYVLDFNKIHNHLFDLIIIHHEGELYCVLLYFFDILSGYHGETSISEISMFF